MNRYKKALIIIAMLLPLLCGISTLVANIVSVIELMIIMFFFSDSLFFVLTPIFFIYASPLVLVGNRLALFTVYCCICVLRIFLVDKKLCFSRKSSLNIIIALMLLSCFVLMFHSSIWSSIIMFIQIITVYYLVVSVKNESELFDNFKNVFVCMCLSGGVYGIIYENIKGTYEEADEYIVQYSGRYAGTTSDPNYMAFFYCIAACYVFFSKSISSVIKLILAFVFFFLIAITGSITALIVFLSVALIYLFFGVEQKISRKIFNSCCIIVAASAFVWYLGSDKTNIEFLSMYKYRVLQKIEFLSIGDISGVTTGRTEYSAMYIEYLFQQSPMRILFGGYQINAAGLAGEAFSTIRFAPHNSYIDVLMTNGVIGLMCFVFAIVYSIISGVYRWIKDRSNANLERFVYTSVVALYILGLSVYPAPQYMFFLLL